MTTTLWRPVGQAELDLIESSGWRRFPPRLEGQPIFYPVLNEEYATKIARDWNTKDPASGFVGYVLRFEVDTAYVEQFEPQRVGGAGIDELWVPAGRLEEFNDNIVGLIDIVATYRGPDSTRWQLWRQDDHGNEFLMRTFDDRVEAESARDEFTARGHHQHYWVKGAT